jgi:hypothetical protein
MGLGNGRVLSVAAILLLICGCSADGGSGPEQPTEYVCGFVTISAPAIVAAADTLDIEFRIRMADTCHRFSHYELNEGPNRRDFTMWGRIETGPCIAAQYIEYIDYSTTELEVGDFRIVIHFANGDSLVHVTTVK